MEIVLICVLCRYTIGIVAQRDLNHNALSAEDRTMNIAILSLV